MSDTTTIDNTQNPMPTVQQFADSVKGQLSEWNASTVEGLCTSQTQTVIEDLAPYYHGDSDNYILPTVGMFKQVIREFQYQKGRQSFDELTESEVTELIALLDPHFRHTAEVVTEG